MTIVDDKPAPAPGPAPSARTRTASGSRRRRLKAAALGAVAVVLLLSPFWAPTVLRTMDFFRVRHVEVVGARYLDPREIVERLAVDTLASVWDPTAPLAARLADYPLVAEVEIGRRLPGTIVVRVREHAPVALVSTPSGFRAYDERGVALPIDPAVADVDAPILARPDSAVLRLLGAARSRAPAFFSRVSEVRRDGAAAPGASGGELVFVLDSLPVRAGADVTLHRLEDVQHVEQDLARRKVRAIELDLRYRDQVIARLP